MTSQETSPIPRISALDPKFREPRTEDEMIPVRIAEIDAYVKARGVPHCPLSKEHGLTVARDPRTQTYEQLYVGISFNCTQCTSSTGLSSRELAHYHGRPYTDGSQWWKYDAGQWVQISNGEASAFWDRFLAWQNARHQEMFRAARRGKRGKRSAAARAWA